MDTEKIDLALAELADLEWHWQHEGRPFRLKNQIAELAGRLMAELPEEYRPYPKSIMEGVSGQSTAASLDPSPVESQPSTTDRASPLAEAEAFLTAMPEMWNELPEPVLEQLRAAPAQSEAPPEQSLTMAAGQLPARNSGTTARHVQLFTQNNGLIHGGTIRIGSGALVCRAFRFFNWEGLTRTDVVAGVCEQMDASGKVVQRWTTADRLKEMYQSATQPLPGFAASTTPAGKTHGFYVSEQHIKNVALAVNKTLKTKKPFPPVETPDNGTPATTIYQGRADTLLGVMNPFSIPPGPDTAVENALFSTQPGATGGFIVKTPYLSVFSPTPQLPVVIVSMVTVSRVVVFGLTKRGIRREMFERNAPPVPTRSFRLR
jgi:hypothetical protein